MKRDPPRRTDRTAIPEGSATLKARLQTRTSRSAVRNQGESDMTRKKHEAGAEGMADKKCADTRSGNWWSVRTDIRDRVVKYQVRVRLVICSAFRWVEDNLQRNLPFPNPLLDLGWCCLIAHAGQGTTTGGASRLTSNTCMVSVCSDKTKLPWNISSC